jgi:hypothetical protein
MIEFSADAKAIECLDAERQERFANVDARKLFPLEDNHAPARFRKQRRRGTAGRAAANNCNVVEISIHLSVMLTSFDAKQRWIEQPSPQQIATPHLHPLPLRRGEGGVRSRSKLAVK